MTDRVQQGESAQRVVRIKAHQQSGPSNARQGSAELVCGATEAPELLIKVADEAWVTGDKSETLQLE